MILPSAFYKLRSRLVDWVLGSVPEQRLRVSQVGLALALTALSIVVMQYFAWIGDLPGRPIAWWMAFSLGGSLGAYVLIRSDVSKRFADPSLTLPQIVHAIASCAFGYALLGEFRGAVFPMLMIVLMFGMFQLRAAQALAVSLYALLLFGTTMAVMSRLQPLVYAPTVEIGHYLILLTVLPAVSVLVGRLSRIRQRLAAQKRELAQALERVQSLSMHDDLTGLLNRRQMQILLEQEVQRCLRNGKSFCVGMLDIDHFKRVNDLYGHAGGDEVLRAFAQAGLRTVRTSDTLARWGGEEFVVLQPDVQMPAARAGIERFREKVQAMRVAWAGQEIAVTVSAGLTEHRSHETLAQTIERADKLLYEAKKQGRNRVIGD